MTTSGKKLIGNSAFLFLDWGVGTALSLLFWLVVGKLLTSESYGVVATSINLIVLLSGLSLLGTPTTVVKMISEFNRSGQRDKIAHLIRLCMKVGLSISLLIALFLAIFAYKISPIINLPVEAIYITCVGIVLSVLWGLSTAILYGFQSMKHAVKTNLVGNVLKVVAAVSLVIMGFDYAGPILGLLLSIFMIVLLRRNSFLMAFRASKDAPLNSRMIFAYSSAAFTASIISMGLSNSPNIILNTLSGAAMTGIFALSMTITSPIVSIPSVLTGALFPITSELAAEKGGKAQQRFLINTVTRYVSLMTLPVIAILLAFSGTIIRIFANATYLSATDLLPIVGAAAFMFGTAGIFNSSIYAMRRPAASRNITLLALVVFLVLSIPLTYYMNAKGMAVAYMITTAVYVLANAYYLTTRLKLRIDVQSLLKIAVAVALFSVLLFGVDRLVTELAWKFVYTVVASLIYLLVLIPLGFYRREDLRILEYLSQKAFFGKRMFGALHTFLSRYVNGAA